MVLDGVLGKIPMLVNHNGDYPTVLRIAKAYLQECVDTDGREIMIHIKKNQFSRTSADDFILSVDLPMAGE
jgi:hypothetical protein